MLSCAARIDQSSPVLRTTIYSTHRISAWSRIPKYETVEIKRDTIPPSEPTRGRHLAAAGEPLGTIILNISAPLPSPTTVEGMVPFQRRAKV